jgi:alginate O-acetyltransferase complex protein AlgJ
MAAQPQAPDRKPKLPMLSGLALALILAAGAVLALLRPGLLSRPGQGGLLDGKWTDAYERKLEARLPFRRFAVTAWGTLRYVLFAQGNRGVLVGRDGWLFTAEEFQSARELEPALRVDLGKVREAGEQLSRRGARLVVAVVPAKARVYPEMLGRYSLPQEEASRYRKLLQRLKGLGIAAPDLLGPLLQAKQQGPVFLRTDTHWTPLGAEAAAGALAEAAEADLREAGSPRVRFLSTAGPRLEYRGDLLNFLPLGRLDKRLGPRPDSLQTRQTTAAEPPQTGLFDRQDIPVVLVGTSYSAGEPWNLEGALKAALGADVLNVSEEGQGALAPMRKLLSGPVLEQIQADVVVWEIPERYFLLP